MKRCCDWRVRSPHRAMLAHSPCLGSCTIVAAGCQRTKARLSGGFAQLLIGEPPGLCIGKVQLSDGEETLGVLGEPALCEGQREITSFGGWRAYIAARDATRG